MSRSLMSCHVSGLHIQMPTATVGIYLLYINSALNDALHWRQSITSQFLHLRYSVGQMFLTL